MTYYSDLQCPVCADFTLNSGFGELLAKDVRAGKVKIVYRAFQTATRDPQAFQAQQGGGARSGPELFYLQQGPEGTSYVTDSYLTDLANQIPRLNISNWRSTGDDSSLISQVQSDQQAASAAGVQGTPTLIFEGPRWKAQAPASVPNSTPNSPPRPPTAHRVHKHGARSNKPSTHALPTQSSATETIT